MKNQKAFDTVTRIIRNITSNDTTTDFERLSILADEKNLTIVVSGPMSEEDIAVLEYLKFEPTSIGSMQWKN